MNKKNNVSVLICLTLLACMGGFAQAKHYDLHGSRASCSLDVDGSNVNGFVSRASHCGTIPGSSFQKECLSGFSYEFNGSPDHSNFKGALYVCNDMCTMEIAQTSGGWLDMSYGGGNLHMTLHYGDGSATDLDFPIKENPFS